VRDYVKAQGIKVDRAQLDLLVPAFEAACRMAERRLGPRQNLRQIRGRLAQMVVDLVIAGGMTDPEAIAEAAIRRALP